MPLRNIQTLHRKPDVSTVRLPTPWHKIYCYSFLKTVLFLFFMIFLFRVHTPDILLVLSSA